MSTESVTNILRALYNSVLEAQRLTEQEHIRQLRRYTLTQDDDPDLAPETEGVPRTVPIQVPDNSGSLATERTIQVPLLALMPPSCLTIRDLTVSFQARLLGFNNEPGTVPSRQVVPDDPEFHSGPIQAALGDEASAADGGGDTAQFTVTFVAGEPPEAFSRLIDRLTQGTLP